MMLATSGNQSSLAELTVLPNAVVALQVLGARPMAVAESLALRAAGRDAEGEEVSGVPVEWTSSDSSIAAVDRNTGVVVGRARGSVRITATADDISAWIRLTVLPRPEPLGYQRSAETDRGRRLGRERTGGVLRRGADAQPEPSPRGLAAAVPRG